MTNSQDIKHSFPPVVDERVHVLVLGSLPGEQSLAEQRYYAHPRNQFWKLIGGVLGTELVALPYAERLQALLERRIGLWDVVASAVRPGSLDAAIRGYSGNDLAALSARLPELRAIGFNGGTSFSIGQRQLAGSNLALLPLPSSSPAFTLSYAEKLERWLALRAYLD